MGTWEKTIFRGRGTEKRAPGREHGKGLLGQEGETDRDVEDVKGEGEQDEGVCVVCRQRMVARPLVQNVSISLNRRDLKKKRATFRWPP